MPEAPTPPDPPAPLEDPVVVVQREIQQAIQRANLTHDPLRFVLSAIGAAVAAIGEAVERARQPVDPAARLAAVEAMVREAKRQFQAEVASLAREGRRRRAWTVAGVVVGVALAAGASGYAIGRQATRDEVRSAGAGLSLALTHAQAWIGVVRANPDLPAAVATARRNGDCAAPDGRDACKVPLWMQPAGVPKP